MCGCQYDYFDIINFEYRPDFREFSHPCFIGFLPIEGKLETHYCRIQTSGRAIELEIDYCRFPDRSCERRKERRVSATEKCGNCGAVPAGDRTRLAGAAIRRRGVRGRVRRVRHDEAAWRARHALRVREEGGKRRLK